MAECVVCRDEAREFARVAAALPLASPRQEVPGELRKRVRRAVRAEPRSAVGPAQPRGGAAGLEQRSQEGAPERRRAQERPERRRASWPAWPRAGAWAAGALAVVAIVVVAVVLVSGGGGSTGVRVYQASVGQGELRIQGGHGDLLVRGLALPRAGRIYEMWLRRGNQAPTPSGLFSVTSGGTADVAVPGNVNGVSTVLVTEEPAGGSSAPTGQPLVVARVG
jgi:hypothetical protein